MTYNFIRTSDETTAELLRKEGYVELTESSSKDFCFINDSDKLNFEGNKKITYTNVLYI